jgi:hypothetical protein
LACGYNFYTDIEVLNTKVHFKPFKKNETEENMTMDQLDNSRELLNEFFAEINKLEGTLSGGEKLNLGEGGRVLDSLRETRIELGNPDDKLIQLTPKLFEEVGFTRGEIYKRQVSDTYDFYYITMPVNLFGAPGVQFDDLICELNFGPKGNQEPIIQALFPTSEWHEVLSYGAGSTLGVNADFGWEVGLNLEENEITKLAAQLPQSISGNIQTKNNLKGFIVVPDFKFAIGRKDIGAAGLQNSRCRWIVSTPELHRLDNLEFGVVFKVPKAITTLELSALVTAQPSLSWLAMHLRHLSTALSQKFRDVVNGTASMPLGDGEKWSLALPK